MSHYILINVTVTKFSQSKTQAIIDALEEQWDFEGFETHTATDQDSTGLLTLSGSGCGDISGSEEERMDQLQKAVWKANGAFCEMTVCFYDLEQAPCIRLTGEKQQYDALKLSGGRMKYLLLKWVGYWTNVGPDHGRDCLFDSANEALDWAKKEYGNDHPMIAKKLEFKTHHHDVRDYGYARRSQSLQVPHSDCYAIIGENSYGPVHVCVKEIDVAELNLFDLSGS